MKSNNAPIVLLFITSPLLLLPPISSQLCQKYCGNIPLKYPLGSSPGCGDPRFQKSVSCSQKQLTFITHTGSYTITDIDYNNQIMYISDPTMSTCFCRLPTKGFGLDWDAPFSFSDATTFALLGCSPTSSPIYKATGPNATYIPQCDNDSTPLCSALYSCQPISQLNVPISTCCVYTPVDLGPSFEMDLQKLQCSSYTAVYSFNGQEDNPQSWKYGVALKYKFNVNNDFPGLCASCERSNGVCGYNSRSYNSFICNCPSGINTTSDCYFQEVWNHGFRLLPLNKGSVLMYAIALSVICMLMH